MAESTYRNLVERLNEYRRVRNRLAVATGLVRASVAALVALALVVAVETLLWLPPSGRHVLVWSGLVAVVSNLLGFVLVPSLRLLLRKESPVDLAYEVGGRFPDVADRLGNALQIYESSQRDSDPVQRSLARAGLEQAARLVEDLDFRDAVDSEAWRKTTRQARWWALGLALFALLFVKPLGAGTYRLVHWNRVFYRGPVLQIQVEPGNVEILRGKSVEIRAQVAGGSPESVFLEISPEDVERKERRETKADSAGVFHWRLSSVDRSFRYWVRAGRFASPEYLVRVVEPPILRTFRIRMVYPRYTGLGVRTLEPNVGDVTALPGTRVSISGQANKELAGATLLFERGDSLALRVDGRRVAGDFVVRRDDRYSIRLRDTSGYLTPEPIVYRISVMEDATPVVSIPIPGEDVDLGESMELPLLVIAEDDFGFSRAELRYRLLPGNDLGGAVDTSEHVVKLPLREKGPHLRIDYNWSLASLGLLPEDEVSYYAVVYDNDTVKGPKKGVSRTYRARFPSVFEIYQEVAEQQQQTLTGLEEVRQQSEDLKQKIRELSREMLRETKVDWTRKQEIEEALKRQEKALEQLRQVEQKLNQAVEKMEKNQLLARETLEKYQKLQELMQEVATPQLKEALRKLQEALKTLDPKRIEQAMKNLQANQEDLLKSLDRTIELLKRLRLQQKLDELANKLDNLLQRQETVNKTLSKQETEARKLAQQEKQLARDAEDVEKTLRELNQEAKKVPGMPTDQLDSAVAAIDSASIAAQMKQAQQQMQAGQRQQALKTGQQAMAQMMKLAQQIQSAKNAMTGQETLEAMKGLQQVAWQALELSQEQEKLWREMQQASRNGQNIPSLAERQADVREALQRVAEDLIQLSQKTFAVSPEVARALGEAAAKMDRALSSLESRNPGAARNAAFEAMNALNRLSMGVQSALQQAAGSSGQGGMEQWLQQMMGLSNQQQWLNQQTMQFGLGQKWSAQQQAALERLAAQQEALRQMLEQLMREAAGQTGSTGRLDRVAEDMQKVADDLQHGRIRQETLDRQERILSRLLDAQRSIRRQGLSRKRKAQSARRQLASRPGALPPGLGEKVDSWRAELLRALREGYAKDYRRWIERYFEAMSRGQEGAK